jgi:glycosyltransferase involved in cell wall biosynthesis
LKEADVLSANGFDVTVVTVNNHAGLHVFDEALMKTRSWKLRTVNYRKEQEKWKWVYLSMRQRFFLLLSRISFKFGIAERAAEKAYNGLASLAGREKADLYIAHHVEALGAAYKAARKNKAVFGFDAEDFHTGMSESSSPASLDAITFFLEKKYLGYCRHMTAASKLMAEAYRDKYGVSLPETILNVFPMVALPVKEVHDPVRFHWYSQVIGPFRGIEVLLEAAAMIEMPFEIHLRGTMQSSAYRHTLTDICQRTGISQRVFFHDPIQPEQIIPDGNNYDVGLALESAVSTNRNICVTNKVFSYLMSRMAIIGTDTEGQKDIFTHFPEAVVLCKMNDARDLARAMRLLIEDRERLMKAKQASERAAREEFNWEKESQKLLHSIQYSL